MQRTFMSDSQATTDGHTLTFLANSGKLMASNGLTVDLDSLTVPIQNGEYKHVADLTDDDVLQVPLMTNHYQDVQSQAGAVRKLWRDESGLMAQAKLSDVPAGQTVQQLAKDGALTNSFSIGIEFDQMPGKDGVIHDSRLLEISVVYKGADDKAAFRSLNQKGTHIMGNENTKTIDPNQITGVAAFQTYMQSLALDDDEKKTLIDKLSTALADTVKKTVEDEEPAEDGAGDDDNGGTPPPAAQQNKRETKKGATLMNPIIINQPKPVARQNFAHAVDSRKSWLDSKEATFAYEDMLRNDTTGDGKEFAANWAEFARQKLSETASFGIDADSVKTLVPTSVASEIEDIYNNGGSGLWQMLQKTNLDQLTITKNDIGLNKDEGRAHGYATTDYGTAKKEEKISLLKRVLSPEFVYKYLKVNKGDLRKTQKPGALLKYITSELPSRIINTIEHSVIFNDWDDMNMFRSVVADAADTTSTDWQGSEFALTQTAAADETLLETFIKASAKVRASGSKVLITKSDTLAKLQLAKGDDGHFLVPLGANLAALLGVSQIITPEWWFDENDAMATGVIMTPSNYALVGDTSIESFTNFALKTNEHEFLQELYTGGGLRKIKSAVVVKSAAQS